MRPIHILAIICIILGLSCASQGVISGGPEDKTPPKVVEEKSSPNYQTNFSERIIELTFDEFVTINNPLKELVISPPLTYLPRIEGRGKKIKFSFNENEALKEEATYSINFGQSIKDFRANNPLENYTFVFSTGDYIDSLSIAGTVVKGIDNKKMKDVLVMLYTDLRDSVPFLEKPFYSTRTDAEGKFKINNIKSDTFKLFALKDENVNYLYDLDEEFIAYLDLPLFISDSTQYDDLKLFAFQQDPTLKIINIDSKQLGIVKVLFNQAIETFDFTHTYEKDFIYEYDNDTLLLFYDTTALISDDTLFGLQDTFLLKKPRSTSKTPGIALRSISYKYGASLSPQDSLLFRFSTPLKSLVKDSIIFVDSADMKLDFDVYIKDTISRTLVFKYKETEFMGTFFLKIKPKSIVDLYGQSNLDSIEYAFTLAKAEDCGIIQLDFSPLMLDSNNYIIEFRSKETVLKRFESDRLTDSIEVFSFLPPGTYNLRLVQDRNHNGKQDAGNYLLKAKQEAEKKINLQAIKADWQLEEVIYWEEVIAPPDAPAEDNGVLPNLEREKR